MTAGRIKGLDLDTAVYVEAEHGLHGPDNLETKLLLERRTGPFHSCLDLIAEKALTSAVPVAFGDAASVDYEISEDIRLGAEAFGELRTSDKTTTSEHFVGPALKVGLDHVGRGELELRTGYLFAVGCTRKEAKGQPRFGVEHEF